MDYKYDIYKGDMMPLFDDYSVGASTFNDTKEIDVWSGYYSSKPVYK
jgi:hypothetical protein